MNKEEIIRQAQEKLQNLDKGEFTQVQVPVFVDANYVINKMEYPVTRPFVVVTFRKDITTEGEEVWQFCDIK